MGNSIPPTPPIPPEAKPKITVGNDPADVFIACVVRNGSQQLEVLSDGKMSHEEYMLMLTGALQGILTQIQADKAKTKSRIVDPFAGACNGRFFLQNKKG